MSDILDALRKAELAREHAQAPGIFTQQRYTVTRSALPRRWRWGMAGAFVLGLSCAGLLVYAGRSGVSAQMAMDASDSPASSGAPGSQTKRRAPVAAVPLRVPGPRHVPVLPAAPDPAPVDDLGTEFGRSPDAAAEPEMLPDRVPQAVADDDVAARPARTQQAPLRDPFLPSVSPSAAEPTGEMDRLLAALPAEPADGGMPEVSAKSQVSAKPEVSAKPVDVVSPSALASETAAPAEDGVPLLRTLPYRFQNTVPKLVINAQAYAAEADARFVIVNMKKYQEGQRTAEGILVEAIRPEDTVFVYQGQWFRLQR